MDSIDADGDGDGGIIAKWEVLDEFFGSTFGSWVWVLRTGHSREFIAVCLEWSIPLALEFSIVEEVVRRHLGMTEEEGGGIEGFR